MSEMRFDELEDGDVFEYGTSERPYVKKDDKHAIPVDNIHVKVLFDHNTPVRRDDFQALARQEAEKRRIEQLPRKEAFEAELRALMKKYTVRVWEHEGEFRFCGDGINVEVADLA